MLRNFRLYLLMATLILIAGVTAPVSAASLAADWKEHPMEGNVFSGVVFSADGSVVYAGGSKMILRSWDGTREWGGKAGTAAAMSPDSNFVISGNANSVVLYDRDGVDIWTRNFNRDVRAVAISPDNSFIVEEDDSGMIQSWAGSGDFIGRNTTFPLVKSLKISPDGYYVVAATDEGLKSITPTMNLIWEDTKNGSWDSLIAISDDGSTIITAGGTRVSSHTAWGRLNWMKDFSSSAITDMACSADCAVIVIGSQDGKVQVINRYGDERWDFTASQWVNGVGVSRNGQEIAVGSLDKNLYVLDGSGNVITQVKTDAIIQPRSVAVNGDGSRIAVADELTLYGYEVIQGPEPTLTTRMPTPLPTYSFATIPTRTVTTQAMVTEVTEPETPGPTPTKSGPGPAIAIIATAGIALVLARRKT